MRLLLLVVFVVGCALHTDVPTERPETQARLGKTDCGGYPDSRTGGFEHAGNRLFASFGEPRHRGIDVIASESDENQTVAGKLAYTAADKDLGHELVEVFACLDERWHPIGMQETDRDGRFTIKLSGAHRLPAGTTRLFAHVPGDGSGVEFLAYIAKAGESVIVTDVDGTITESENAILNTVLFGDDIANRRGAPAALANSGHTVVYLSARGDQFTEVTRRWLRQHGFPPGPIRLARASITSPGKHTVTFKTGAVRQLGVPIFAAIGNKQTDIQAYANAGVPATRIFIKLPEFEGEVREDLRAGRAVGFNDFRALPSLLH